ncbi:tyrosinase family protein [Alkalihalobacillus sp. AL-G]|uniref:tyrosinase family protein n=1 Tax=Alkalihalobacillus sp. AL-G TaxID=2926399 RepID=UPI00272C95BB|nr:tyrosinase family protein [Alkalihalobacillus sp. AL-G]WLD94365.1 tyrosinase family protein [Alkalihalobacillus sp. AL-G]
MATTYNVRKNVRDLTDREKRDFVNAVLALKERGTYDRYVRWHAEAGSFQTPEGSDRNAAHMGPSFLPWHREFIYRFERDLQSEVQGVVLPYWDWAADAQLSDPSASPVWGSDFMGGNGNPNNDFLIEDGPFAADRWTIVDENGNASGGLQRNFGASERSPTLPTEADIRNALEIVPYDDPPWNMNSTNSFRNYLEGFIDGPQLHNRVHVWVGGHMQFIPTAPNDPVFFLHHANVDRIWTIWQIIHQNEPYLPITGGPTGHNLNDSLYPWSTTILDVINHRDLGYVYDTEVNAVLRTRRKRAGA